MKQDTSPETELYLAQLGERVRAERAKRGMTRKILARDSGVSERYLAQLESGGGNPSISVIRQIAVAMDLSVSEIVSEASPHPGDSLARLFALARRSSETERQAAVRALEEILTSDTAQSKARRVALVGLRGAGKSTLGRRLAAHRNVPFVELNRLVEQEYGGSIGEILALNGQPAFRRYERRCLERAVEGHDDLVLSTAGGIVSEASTYAYLLEQTHTIWIKASPEEHMARVVAQGDLRPMARNSEAMDDLNAILAARDPDYRRAEAAIDTSRRSIDDCLEELIHTADRLFEAGENGRNPAEALLK